MLHYPLPKIRCGNYHPEHIKGVVALLGNQQFKPHIWHWQFQHCDQVPPIVMLDQHSRVKGFNGVMPVTISINGQRLSAVWSCDFVVTTECRGQGLGKQIKLALQANYPRLMSLGISDSAVKVLATMGWRSGAKVFTMRRLKVARHWRDKSLLILQGLMLRLLRQTAEVNPDSLRWVSELPEKSEIDLLCERVTGGYERTVVRDFAYLNWRYQQHPLASYDFLCAYNGQQLDALLVVREFDGHLRIVDYLGPNNAARLCSCLLQEALNRYPEHRVVSCTTSDPCWLSVLWRHGFLPQSRQRFYLYSDTDGEPHGWFLMAGDSDGELLQAARGGVK